MNALGLLSLAGMGLTSLALLAMRAEKVFPRGDGLRASGRRWLRNMLNHASFAARRHVRFSRGAYVWPNETKSELFAYLNAADRRTADVREGALRAKYALENAFNHSLCDDYRETVYHLDVLDELGRLVSNGGLKARRDGAAREAVYAIDVGSKDFRYALAIERWITSEYAAKMHLCGVEIDGNGVYRNLHTRRARAEAHCVAVGPHVRYVVDDFLTHPFERVDVVTAFFPFVLPFAIEEWGLPMRYFAPEKFFARYKELIRDGGMLIIANHTTEEKQRTLELIHEVGGFVLVASMPMRSLLVSYQGEVQDRHIQMWRRTP